MKFTTPINIKPNKTIDHNSHILMLGSCFTENIGKKLIESGLNVVMNPMGILYNPISIYSALERIIDGREFTDSDLFFHNGLWASFMHHGSFSHSDKNEALRMMNERLLKGHEQLKNATHLIITFGSAEVYEIIEPQCISSTSKQIVSNCHKLPSRNFTNRLLSIDEITTPYTQLSTLNYQLSTIFTISPVRYLGNGAHNGQINKSTLLLATDQICQKTKADYFPAYEIMMDELRDYRYYAADMIHPSEIAVDYIFERFTETYFTPEAIRTAEEVQKIKKSLSHRPLHPDSEEYKKFQKKLLQQIDAITKKYPVQF
ncbi:MAG: GSCFA domain-containing protein [Paludibacteraceae bacterium]|nr:GSCFA domain-containing protein [Paludibacteraceae bacterium]